MCVHKLSPVAYTKVHVGIHVCSILCCTRMSTARVFFKPSDRMYTYMYMYNVYVHMTFSIHVTV